jgi:hypothetical protein
MFNFNTFIMKKIKIFWFLVLGALIFFAFSCSKNEVINSTDLFLDNENNDKMKQNEATWISSSEELSKWWFLKITIKIGHTPADCGNKCVKIFGELGHIDCRGFGNVCTRIANAKLIQDGGILKLVLEESDALCDDLDFLLPDRTLYITNPLNNTDLWLNIPEQVLLRDNNGVPFEILDIWFSEEPELENK